MMILPRHVLGGPGYQAPSDTLNIACVGVGGKGSSDIVSVSTENVAALVDVDLTKYRPIPRFGQASTGTSGDVQKGQPVPGFPHDAGKGKIHRCRDR